MPILRISVENPDELLNASMLDAGALGRVERATTEAGTYSEIGTFALVATQKVYVYYDAAGADSSWYRVRFSKSGGASPTAYGDAFQAGDEGGGLLCSIYDVKQRLFGTATIGSNEEEILLELIREVSQTIEHYCGRWFAPRPLSGTATYLFDVASDTRRLWLPRGIRSITTLGIASSSQPDSGGTYTTATATDYVLRPTPSERDPGWPATSLLFLDNAAGPVTWFYPGLNTVSIAGAFGWAAVPYEIQGIAIAAVTRKYLGKETATPAVQLGPEGGLTILRDISPSDRAILDAYRSVSMA